MKGVFLAVSVIAFLAVSCEELDNDIRKHGAGDADSSSRVSLGDVAVILSEIPLELEQMNEVHDAVSSSSENGYDEEYMMRDLFSVPGAGVGDDRLPEGTKARPVYDRPMRELIREYLHRQHETRSGIFKDSRIQDVSPEEILEDMQSSDMQIYWPYSENWDGKELPVITFDPMDGAETNIGYRIVVDADGRRTVEEVIADEQMAIDGTVWVVNRNDDSGYNSLEILRREDPDWGTGGGEIIVRPQSFKAGTGQEAPLRTLILREFTMLRNYDSWFAGASEFFVKIGSVEGFTASTEAELKLYSPTVTDFMIVVKRKYKGVPRPFNAVLVSDWTDQLEQCAFLISEDDGGTRTSWKCTALVRIASKSYGVEIELPINTRDDIVWRGQLSSRYIMANNNVTGHFGDVDLKFEVQEY